MEKNVFQQVGKNIQKVLLEQNKSQQYLANKLDISKQVMSKIVMGTKAINVAEITKIAKVLNVSVDTLLDVKDENKEIHKFAFMGRVENEETKQKIEFLKTVIDEIIMLEEYADDKC